MKYQIGEISGQIWRLLRQRGEISLSTLPREIGQKPLLTYQALGWLAREDKLTYRQHGRKTLVSLTNFNTD